MTHQEREAFARVARELHENGGVSPDPEIDAAVRTCHELLGRLTGQMQDIQSDAQHEYDRAKAMQVELGFERHYRLAFILMQLWRIAGPEFVAARLVPSPPAAAAEAEEDT